MTKFHKKISWRQVSRWLYGCIFVVVYLFGVHMDRMQKWNKLSARVVQVVQEPSSTGNRFSFYVLISGEGDSFSKWVFAMDSIRNKYFLETALWHHGNLHREQRLARVYIAKQTDTIEFHRTFMVAPISLPAMQRYFSAPANFICADSVELKEGPFQEPDIVFDPDWRSYACERFYTMAHAKASQEWRPWQWPYFFDARPILPAWLMPDGVPHPVSPPSSMLTSSKKKGL